MLPAHVTPDELAGRIVIIIDTLRASTVICTALANGAAEIRPTLTVEEARSAAAELRTQGRDREGRVVLGGERGGVRIEGFDLDNSPAAYSRQAIGGATLVFTTTNGTAALLHASRAARVLVGCFANLSAVCDAVAEDQRPVHILCAGTHGEVSMDDCLAAGAMVERLSGAGRVLTSDDSALMCLHAWKSCGAGQNLSAALATTRGGRPLVEMGFGADIERCAAIDSAPVVPEFHLPRGVITRS
jgi:2-phosphosulfolactate phosphatase